MIVPRPTGRARWLVGVTPCLAGSAGKALGLLSRQVGDAAGCCVAVACSTRMRIKRGRAGVRSGHRRQSAATARRRKGVRWPKPAPGSGTRALVQTRRRGMQPIMVVGVRTDLPPAKVRHLRVGVQRVLVVDLQPDAVALTREERRGQQFGAKFVDLPRSGSSRCADGRAACHRSARDLRRGGRPRSRPWVALTGWPDPGSPGTSETLTMRSVAARNSALITKCSATSPGPCPRHNRRARTGRAGRPGSPSPRRPTS